MAEVRILIDVCDLCGAEGHTKPQRIGLNRRKGKVDTCADCEPKIVDTMAAWFAAGEPLTSRR